MTTAIESGGSRRRSRRTLSPASTVSPKMRAGAGCLALMWRSASTPMTRPTPASGPTGSSAWFTDPVARPSSDGRVQSNQFQRAVDLARRFLHAGLPVCIGGFHVSGSIAMLATMPAEMREGAALGISFFAGAAEHGRLDPIIRDAWDGSLLPLYNYISDLPSLEGEPAPILPRKHVRRVSGQLSSLDLGRGCPYQCSFCTIINVQGRKSRFRTPTISNKRSAKTIARATDGSSSPMITSRAIAIGSRSLIG